MSRGWDGYGGDVSSTYRRRPAPVRRGRQVPYVPDPCPACASDLGGPAGTTRRAVVFSTDRGVFRWRCPECRHVWSDGPAGTPDAVDLPDGDGSTAS